MYSVHNLLPTTFCSRPNLIALLNNLIFKWNYGALQREGQNMSQYAIFGFFVAVWACVSTVHILSPSGKNDGFRCWLCIVILKSTTPIGSKNTFHHMSFISSEGAYITHSQHILHSYYLWRFSM